MDERLAEAITDAVARIDNILPRFGKPRPLANAENAKTWREVRIGNDVFRVLTLEDN